MAGTTNEHRTPRSVDPSQANRYSNCFYACRMCNTARGNRSVESRNGRLLDPAKEAWGDHFRLEKDHFFAKTGDRDAQYTGWCYDLNDARKVERRKSRRELVTDRLALLNQLDLRMVGLLELAARVSAQNPHLFLELWPEIVGIRFDALRALKDLKRYRVIPKDAPNDCLCGRPELLVLPASLAVQLIEMPEFDSW